MKHFFYSILVLCLICIPSKAFSISLEECTIDCSGYGIIETTTEEVEEDEFRFGLRYESDSLGNHQYYIRFNLTKQKHFISKNRLALIKFEEKANLPILELKAQYQVNGTKKVKSWKYKFQQNFNGVINGPYNAASNFSMMDDEDRYNLEPNSNTYYPISDADLKTIMDNKVKEMRFDTADEVIEINGKEFSEVITSAYKEINKCFSKDVRADF